MFYDIMQITIISIAALIANNLLKYLPKTTCGTI